ncbi:MAG: tetratricopeptide repeat protein [Ignavibacteriae bacterium]|nr:tetratricopeptide repeat protein [Ignavibacteria bacterium]MBI3364358.1 tetratricopeptide repeat protein [Ignavibacteriota bacterium]
MKRLLFVVLIVFSQHAFAQEAALQFEQANQFYRGGDYQKAAQLYEQVLKNGYEHFALYYNLGNAYFKLQKIPGAILAYERAKRLVPNDEDIQYNLRLANLRVIDKIEPLPQLFFIQWWNAFLGLFSSSGWALIGIGALWLAVGAGMLFFLLRSVFVQRLAVFGGLLLVIAAALSFISMYQQHRHEQSDRTAIVFAPSVSVKSAPDGQSTDLFVVHEGVKIELLDSVGEWKKIRLADGKVGWMMTESIQVI